MVFVGAVEPTAEDTCSHRVEKGVLQLSCHNLRVVFGQNDERGLAEVFVSDGDFARHDVGQGVDECRWTGEKVLWVLDSRLIGSVGLQGGTTVEEHHSAVFARNETLATFGLQQQLGSHKPNLLKVSILKNFG